MQRTIGELAPTFAPSAGARAKELCEKRAKARGLTSVSNLTVAAAVAAKGVAEEKAAAAAKALAEAQAAAAADPSDASLAPVKDELRKTIVQEVTALKHGTIADLMLGAKGYENMAESPARSINFLCDIGDLWAALNVHANSRVPHVEVWE